MTEQLKTPAAQRGVGNRDPKRRGQGPPDPNRHAWEVVQQAIGEMPKECPPAESKRAQIGRMGGLKGGEARASKLTPERRAEIAKKAAEKRWAKS